MRRISALSFAIAVTLFSVSFLLAQSDSTATIVQADNLMNRIKSIKHIGLSVDEKMSAYVLYLYTPTQRDQNLSELVRHRQAVVKHNAEIKSVQEKRRLANNANVTVDERNKLAEEHNRLLENLPRSQFSRNIILYDVIGSGVDYVEIRSAEKEADETTLIPMSRICKVIDRTSSDRSSPNEPSDASNSK